MRIIFLLSLLLITFNSSVFAQVQVPFEVSVFNKATGKAEPGSTVKVLTGGSAIQTVTVDGSGKVNLKIPGGKKYKVEISKPGKVMRFVNLDLSNVVDELLQGSAAPKGELKMSLFDEVAGFDFSYVSTNASTEYYFDPSSSSNLLPDDQISAKTIKKVDELLKAAEKSKGQSDAAFNAAVKKADDFYTQKKYTEALAAYGEALKLKQTDAHSNQRYLEVEGILKSQKANNDQLASADNEYKALIAAADQLFAQKKYEEAKARYNEAFVKKQEQYAKDQVAKIDTEIARLQKEKENEGKYTAAKTTGDSFMKQGSFQSARDSYKEALKWKKDDPYATGKLAEIEGKLNIQKGEQDKKKLYEEANAAGEALMAQEKWAEAKVEFQKALAIQPSSAYTQEKIKEADTKLDEIAKNKAKQDQITKLLAEGTASLAATKLPEAKAKFQEVLKLDDKNAVAIAKITEIDAKLAGEKADAEKIAKIKQLVLEGDALVKQTKLDEAKAKYVEANGLKADEAVQAKIKAIDDQLALNKSKAENKAKYDKAMQEGETLFAAANYEGAKTKYNEALGIDAAQAFPKQRIVEADKKIAELAANASKNEKYTAAYNAGVAALSAKNLPEAKTKLTEAIAIDGTKAEAKAKLKEVDDLLAGEAKAKENAAKYEAAIKAGGDLLTANKLPEAKVKFQEAAVLDGSQTLPAQKIKEIDDLLASAGKQKQIDALNAEGAALLGKKDLAGAKTKYQSVLGLDGANAIATGKLKDIAALEADAASSAEKEANFKKLKDEAVALMSQAKYTEAKTKLNEAKAMKADPSIDPLIKQCDDKLAELASAADKGKRYNDALAAGAAAFTAKNLIEAKSKFTEAVAIDGTKPEAKAKLKEVEDLLAGEAKVKENAAKYDAAIKAGGDLMAAGKLAEAKIKFQEALALDATQTLPAQKIKEIDDQLAASGKQKQIDALITEGNTAFGKKDLTAAKLKFEAVLGLDQSNATAQAKLQEISRLQSDAAGEAQKLADKEASFKKLKDEGMALMGQTKYADAKAKLIEAKTVKADPSIDPLIAQIDAKLSELDKNADVDKKYNALFAEAQALEGSKQYDAAIAKYTEAIQVKNEKLPNDRIAAINQIKAASAKVDADYAAEMKKGDAAVASKDYLEAIKFYNAALAIKPNEKEPVDKAKDAQLKSQGEQDDFTKQYQKVLDVAQKSMDDKNYVKAKEMYNRALTLKADDPLPRQKLAEIEGLLKEEQVGKDKLAAYNKKVADAEASAKGGNLEGAITLFENAKLLKPDETLPDNRIAELRAQIDGKNNAAVESEAKYALLISEGNAFAGTKDYNSALGKYQDALSVKKADKSAQSKISEMKQLLDDLAKNGEKKAQLDKIIAKADAKFAKKDWMDAKAVYEEALSIDPSNKYAIAQIAVCDANAQGAVKLEQDNAYNKLIAAADNNFDSRDYNKAKDYYIRANKNRPSDPYPKRRLREIDNILNPKPVPPVVVSTEPQPLENLGDPNNSLANEALQNAESERRRRRNGRLRRSIEKVENSQDSLSLASADKTQSTDNNLSEIKKENERMNAVSTVTQDENSAILLNDQKILETDQEASGKYFDSENKNSREQIVAAETQINEGNGALDGGYVDNSEILKGNEQTQEEINAEAGQNKYIERIENQAQINAMEINIENKNNIDDTESRRQMEDFMSSGKNSLQVSQNESGQRAAESIYVNTGTLDRLQQNKTSQDYESSKTPSVTDEELKKAKLGLEGNALTDVNNHLEATQVTKASMITLDKELSVSNDKADENRVANVDYMKEQDKKQGDILRQDYNAMVVKSMQTDQSLTTEKKKNDENAAVKTNAPKANNESLQAFESKQGEIRSQESQSESVKYVNNQVAFENDKTKKQEIDAQVSNSASDNSEILKKNDKSLSADKDSQQKAEDTRTQEITKSLTDLDKKERNLNENSVNNLGKLYPEGVSQEQFENKDGEGLLVSVVTRRVVVKDGVGTLFVRTQTLNSTTYSRNGEATTEYAWQRETQNTNLKKNY